MKRIDFECLITYITLRYQGKREFTEDDGWNEDTEYISYNKLWSLSLFLSGWCRLSQDSHRTVHSAHDDLFTQV